MSRTEQLRAHCAQCRRLLPLDALDEDRLCECCRVQPELDLGLAFRGGDAR